MAVTFPKWCELPPQRPPECWWFYCCWGGEVFFTGFVRWAAEGIVSRERMFNLVTDGKAKEGAWCNAKPSLNNLTFGKIHCLSFLLFFPIFFPVKIIPRRVLTRIDSLSTLEVWPLMRLCEITVLSFRSVPCLCHTASSHRPLSC